MATAATEEKPNKSEHSRKTTELRRIKLLTFPETRTISYWMSWCSYWDLDYLELGKMRWLIIIGNSGRKVTVIYLRKLGRA